MKNILFVILTVTACWVITSVKTEAPAKEPTKEEKAAKESLSEEEVLSLEKEWGIYEPGPTRMLGFPAPRPKRGYPRTHTFFHTKNPANDQIEELGKGLLKCEIDSNPKK